MQLLLCAKGSVQLRAMLASVMAVKLKLVSMAESYATSLGNHQAQKKGEPDSHTQNKRLICPSYYVTPPPHTQLTDAYNHKSICDKGDNEAGASTEYTHATGSIEPTPIGEWRGKLLRHHAFLPYLFHEF